MLFVMSALAELPSERAAHICQGADELLQSTCFQHAYTEITNAHVTAYVESIKQEFMTVKWKALTAIVVNGLVNLFNATMMNDVV